MSPRAIDLFSGMGGMSLGLRQAGYELKYTLELEEQAVAIHTLNHPGIIHQCDSIENVDAADIRLQLGLERGELDLLVGGPPCQGFSTYGQRNVHDERNYLFLRFASFIKEFRPRTFIMENVPGMRTLEKGAFFDMVLSTFSDNIGYTCKVMLLNAVNFGVPQNRKRVFIVGSRDGESIRFPTPTHSKKSKADIYNSDLGLFSPDPKGDSPENQDQYDKYLISGNLKPIRTVRDAISDLPEMVLPPKQNNESMLYSYEHPLTEYQIQMRTDSELLWNHSAKRHLARRQLRTAVLDQGDYGDDIHNRIRDEGIPEEILKMIQNGLLDESLIIRARNVDKKAEKMLIDKLSSLEISDELIQLVTAGGFANKYRRLHWDEPSHTLVAHMARDCSDFIHPIWNRPISVREAARLQSFPDNYILRGSQFRQLRYIGNAVPPMLAKAIVGMAPSK